jgi:hypothetical protein
MPGWNHYPKSALHATNRDLTAALERLIPIPNAITHNVALALDELLRELHAAIDEMPEDGTL